MVPATILSVATLLGFQYNMDPNLILSIAYVESNFKVTAVGKSHKEVGLMQLRPKYFKSAKFDVHTNMRLGVEYLAKMRSQCAAYGDAWFICYNRGASKKIKLPTKTAYYRKVMKAYEKISNSRSTASDKSQFSYAQTSQ